MSTRVVEVVPATLEHVAAMAPHMRQADRDEVWASCLLAPDHALRLSLQTSRKAWAGIIDGEVVCIFGVGAQSVLSDVGVPWMLGTDALEGKQFTFLRHCRRYVAEMRAGYSVLVNFVDERNTVSQRWLRWLGFHMDEPEPHGPFGLPFRRFYRLGEECHV